MTDERWHHISIGHPEIAGYYYEILDTIENPTAIYEGNNGGLIAVSAKFEPAQKYFVVIYKETGAYDGFIVTAFISSKLHKFSKKKILWKQ